MEADKLFFLAGLNSFGIPTLAANNYFINETPALLLPAHLPSYQPAGATGSDHFQA